MLESRGMPYTGSKVLASALAMNKIFSALIFKANGLNTPDFEHITERRWKKYKTRAIKAVTGKIGFPCVVKPANQGSAVGVSIVKNETELKLALDKSFKKYKWMIAQKFIKGKEATCGVVEIEGKACPFPPTHILPKLEEFYDYKSKYKKNGSTHICPADFSKDMNAKIQDLAVKAHLALGCRGMSRTDIFAGDDGNPYILETNTIPGMTPTSLYPEAAAKAGISFSKMLDLIIQSSL